MRVLLITGKGGVGKTSVAAATAVRAAARGLDTLVVSTDGAHSLADALETDVGSRPTRVTAHLHAEEIDAQQRLEEQWREIRGYLVALLSWGGVSEVEAEELSVLPGLEEVLSLIDVHRHVTENRYDLLVVDCAPTAETLRLLSLPDVLGWYLERAFGLQGLFARAVRPVIGRVSDVPLPPDTVLASVERLARDLDAVRRVLTDHDRSSIRLVVNPEKMVVAEARRTFTYLALFGYHVDAVVVNRLLPAAVTDPFFDAWKAAQAEHLAAVREGFDGVPVLTVPLLAAEPLGTAALDDLAGRLYGDIDVTAILRRGRPLRVTRTEGGYVLRLELPLVVGDDVALAQKGEELFLTVGGHRRAVLLPAALRRADIVGAAVRDGALSVHFALPTAAA